jgi:hypothetical protein
MSDAWGGFFLGWGVSFGAGNPAPVLILVPGVEGSTSATGVATIESANLTAAVQSAYSVSVPAGIIISQSPVAGSLVAAGTTITIIVSLGPQILPAGTYSQFNPELADIMDEAFERAGIAPLTVGQEQIASFLRSVRLQLFSEWATLQINNWLVKTFPQTLTAGQPNYVMPVGSVDVISMVYVRQGTRTPIERSSRRDMLYLAAPLSPGRPDRFFVDRVATTNNIGLWLVPDRTGDQIIYEYISAAADAGSLSTALELPPIMLEAFIAGIAMRLAQKYNRKLYNDLRIDYGGQRYPDVIGGKLQTARYMDGERADVRFTIHRYPRKR